MFIVIFNTAVIEACFGIARYINVKINFGRALVANRLIPEFSTAIFVSYCRLLFTPFVCCVIKALVLPQLSISQFEI
jgi:hypothetical protein